MCLFFPLPIAIGIKDYDDFLNLYLIFFATNSTNFLELKFVEIGVIRGLFFCTQILQIEQIFFKSF